MSAGTSNEPAWIGSIGTGSIGTGSIGTGRGLGATCVVAAASWITRVAAATAAAAASGGSGATVRPARAASVPASGAAARSKMLASLARRYSTGVPHSTSLPSLNTATRASASAASIG